MPSETPTHPEQRFCVVIPTYNNGRTIADVVEKTRRVLPHIIVVNDGSTDDTPEILDSLPDITLVTQPHNSGKGAALARGFLVAAEMGYTHAIVIDADGQHTPDDISKIAEQSAAHPDRLVIGVRQFSGGRRALKSRILRKHSNFWCWLETGQATCDSQSGFRVYPLEPINRIAVTTARYDYEIEILVKALWTGVKTTFVPIEVNYGPGSESHFRPFKDFALVSRLNASLLARRLFLPGAVLHSLSLKDQPRFSIGEIFRSQLKWFFVDGNHSPQALAACFGIGVFFGILPIWGFQMAAAILVAHLLKLNKAITTAAANISFPAAIPFILYLSLVIGRLSLTGEIDLTLQVGDLTRENIGGSLVEYLIGASLLAVVAGLTAAAVTYGLARVYQAIPGRASK